MSVSREYPARCSAATGYDASSLEKVIRLGELAGDITKHGLLGESLALKVGYRSALGTPNRIEVDLNYLFRTPLEPVAAHPVWQPGDLDRPQVCTVGLTELLVGKMVALLARSAPRDLWDVVNLSQAARDRLRTPRFRSWFVGIASVLNHLLSTYEADSIGRRLTQSDIDEQLGPMLTSGRRHF